MFLVNTERSLRLVVARFCQSKHHFFYIVAKPPFFLLSMSVSSCREGQATWWTEWYNFRELLRHSSMLTWHPCARTYKLWSRALASRKGFWTVKSPFSRPLPWLSRCEEAVIAFYMLMYFLQCIFFCFLMASHMGLFKKKKHTIYTQSLLTCSPRLP